MRTPFAAYRRQEFKTLVFGAFGGSTLENRPQKRVFHEKLTLVTPRVYQRGQQKRPGLDIGSCENRTEWRAMVGHQTTFLDGQTLNKC